MQRHLEAQRLRGLEVDNQLELGRLFDWDVSGFDAAEEPAIGPLDVCAGVNRDICSARQNQSMSATPRKRQSVVKMQSAALGQEQTLPLRGERRHNGPLPICPASLRSGPQLARSAYRLVPHQKSPAMAHSINSSALIRMDVGRVRPSDFATRALTISSMLVGSSIGMSPGLVPFSILSIK
jgi:hypothetical protein